MLIRVWVFLAAAILMVATPSFAEKISVAAWNVEDYDFGGSRSGADGSDGARIAVQLRNDFNGIDVFALSEVHSEDAIEVYALMAGQDEPHDYQYVYGNTGNSIRLGLLINTSRFDVVSIQELDFGLDPNGTRFPLAARLKSKQTGDEFVAVSTHFARGNEANRIKQSQGMREWSQVQDVPVIALGDFNFDYNIHTDVRHQAYDQLIAGDYFAWVEPEKRIDTSWSGNNTDRYPDQILDFVFAGGEARNWQSRSIVYVRPQDFPDNGDYADHRPVVAFFETDSAAAFNPDLAAATPNNVTDFAENRSLRAGTPVMAKVAVRAAEVFTGAPASNIRLALPNRAPAGNSGVGKVVDDEDLINIPKQLWPYVNIGNRSLADILQRGGVSSAASVGTTGLFGPGSSPDDFPPELLPYILGGTPDGYDGR